MNKTEREQTRRIVDDVQRWSHRAAEVQSWHSAVRDAADSGEKSLLARFLSVHRGGAIAVRIVPLEWVDVSLVRHLVERANLPAITPADRSLIHLLTTELPATAAEVGRLLGLRRFFVGPAKKEAAEAAFDFLRQQHSTISQQGGVGRLDHLASPQAKFSLAQIRLETLLDPGLDVGILHASSNQASEMLDQRIFGGLAAAISVIDKVVASEASYRTAARSAGEDVRQADVQRMLKDMPVEALKDATRERLRLGPLADAGITTVQQTLDRGKSLQLLDGVGETSARRMLGAAQALWRTTSQEMPVRIDISNRMPQTTELLNRLAEWDACRQTRGAAADLERAAELKPLAAAIATSTERLLVVPAKARSVAMLVEDIDIVMRRAELLGSSSSARRQRTDPDPWNDFLSRPADYFAMLSELGFLTEDEDAVHGDLPEEIIDAVRDQPLSGEHLTASLRGYQSFAARFALVQRKVVIGDEMGLGKTVEALAVLAHLRSRGASRFVVVCPAGVVTNWIREIGGKTTLRSHRVHGPERARAVRSWARDGGVAVTTFETLAWWEAALEQVSDLACVVVDEAHYIKNPLAQRSMRAEALISRSERAILMTGTPLENKVDEFRNLVSYVRPDLTVDVTGLSPKGFRRKVAPAYLRRNQEDVLTELPELVQVEEWLPMSAPDFARYRRAVGDGNFMAMRQAAMLEGLRSEKVQRLIEIVREAEENKRRVIVFSHFREILSQLLQLLPGQVFGPLTGSVAAHQRQHLVDQFSAARHGAVLVAQIVAGGVGLNIQSASVVVICEPQLKPTTEAQAIARAHRMGQVQSVQVHRLLSEDGVDQRITEILTGKNKIFDDYARVSATADSTPEAVDLSDAELVRQVVAAERQRLAQRGEDR